MGDRHEATTTWLPSTDEIFMASERAILAALDANLQLAVRSLRAEYPGLDAQGRIVPDPDWEPYVPAQVPLVEKIVGSATHLRGLITQYRVTLNAVLAAGTADGSGSAPSGEEDDDPF